MHLRTWAHTLGYRGHILNKSRAYSTTYAPLRAERAHHIGHRDMPDTITDEPPSRIADGDLIQRLRSHQPQRLIIPTVVTLVSNS
ncbi:MULTISPECIES: replication initiator [unclassified Streptomyces]|uniref:replication initiator n=1 Tax=unclassified Streptomyces TaxID=2593676 RepID=UPI0035E16A1C